MYCEVLCAQTFNCFSLQHGVDISLQKIAIFIPTAVVKQSVNVHGPFVYCYHFFRIESSLLAKKKSSLIFMRDFWWMSGCMGCRPVGDGRKRLLSQ